MPFCEAVVWFLTSTRSPARSVTPSMVWRPESVMVSMVATRTVSLTGPPACTRELIVAAPTAEVRLTLRLPPAVMFVETARLAAESRMSPSLVDTAPLSVRVPGVERLRSLTVRTAEPRILRSPVPAATPERIEIGALLAATASTVRPLFSSMTTVFA